MLHNTQKALHSLRAALISVGAMVVAMACPFEGWAATVNITNGVLTYTAGTDVARSVTVSVSGSTLIIAVTGDTITVGSGSFRGGGTGVIGGSTSQFTSLVMTANTTTVQTFNIKSSTFPISITCGSGQDVVNISSNAPTNSGGLSLIGGDITITTCYNITASNATGNGDTNVIVTNNQIQNFAGPTKNYTITYNVTNQLRVMAGGGIASQKMFTLQSPGGAKFRLDAGEGSNTINIRSIGSTNAAGIYSGGGADTISISSDAPSNTGTLATINGTISIDAGGGINTFNVSNKSGIGRRYVSVDATTITGFAGTSGSTAIEYSSLGGSLKLNLFGSDSGENFFRLSSFYSFNTVRITSPSYNARGVTQN